METNTNSSKSPGPWVIRTGGHSCNTSCVNLSVEFCIFDHWGNLQLKRKNESVFSLAMGRLCLTPCISALLLKLLPVPLNSFTDRCVFLSNCIDFTCFRPLDYLWRLTSQGHLHEMFWMVMPKPFPYSWAGDVDHEILKKQWLFFFFFK